MKKTLLTILYIVVFAGGFTAMFLGGPKEQLAPIIDQVIQETTLNQNLESKTDEQAAVTVIITPVNVTSEFKEWKFDVLMDTHSIELDQDMAQISILSDGDEGKEYKPIRWEGAEAGGHHREGVLIFDQIAPIPKFIELKISGIGDVTRNFSWQI